MSQSVLELCAARGHEQVCFFHNPEVGLKVIVAIHDTTLGPGLGGCRMMLYQSESQAVEDVMRLSEGMTYKSALAGLALGGAKACLIADPGMTEGREELFRHLGRCLNHLGGRYITAEDMGTSVRDMMWIKSVSKHVAGTDPNVGGVGDPSPWTALGVFNAMRAAVERAFPDQPALKGKSVAVQGVGHVGMYLVGHLVEAGARVTVADTNAKNTQEAANRYGVSVVAPGEIYSVQSDIFAPCAVGQTVNPSTLWKLSCKVIAGGANNQLSDPSMYELLRTKGILYCPDFAINSGGVISIAAEATEGGASMDWVKEKVAGVYDTTAKILDEARRTHQDTEVVALNLAKQKIADTKRRSLT